MPYFSCLAQQQSQQLTELAAALDAVEVNVVSGPEVLNKFVGTSEEKVRELFAKAEEEWKQFKRGGATFGDGGADSDWEAFWESGNGRVEDRRRQGRQCGLHVIILDELDAICRQRGVSVCARRRVGGGGA